MTIQKITFKSTQENLKKEIEIVVFDKQDEYKYFSDAMQKLMRKVETQGGKFALRVMTPQIQVDSIIKSLAREEHIALIMKREKGEFNIDAVITAYENGIRIFSNGKCDEKSFGTKSKYRYVSSATEEGGWQERVEKLDAELANPKKSTGKKVVSRDYEVYTAEWALNHDISKIFIRAQAKCELPDLGVKVGDDWPEDFAAHEHMYDSKGLSASGVYIVNAWSENFNGLKTRTWFNKEKNNIISWFKNHSTITTQMIVINAEVLNAKENANVASFVDELSESLNAEIMTYKVNKDGKIDYAVRGKVFDEETDIESEKSASNKLFNGTRIEAKRVVVNYLSNDLSVASKQISANKSKAIKKYLENEIEDEVKNERVLITKNDVSHGLCLSSVKDLVTRNVDVVNKRIEQNANAAMIVFFSKQLEKPILSSVNNQQEEMIVQYPELIVLYPKRADLEQVSLVNARNLLECTTFQGWGDNIRTSARKMENVKKEAAILLNCDFSSPNELTWHSRVNLHVEKLYSAMKSISAKKVGIMILDELSELFSVEMQACMIVIAATCAHKSVEVCAETPDKVSRVENVLEIVNNRNLTVEQLYTFIVTRNLSGENFYDNLKGNTSKNGSTTEKEQKVESDTKPEIIEEIKQESDDVKPSTSDDDKKIEAVEVEERMNEDDGDEENEKEKVISESDSIKERAMERLEEGREINDVMSIEELKQVCLEKGIESSSVTEFNLWVMKWEYLHDLNRLQYEKLAMEMKSKLEYLKLKEECDMYENNKAVQVKDKLGMIECETFDGLVKAHLASLTKAELEGKPTIIMARGEMAKYETKVSETGFRYGVSHDDKFNMFESNSLKAVWLKSSDTKDQNEVYGFLKERIEEAIKRSGLDVKVMADKQMNYLAVQ